MNSFKLFSRPYNIVCIDDDSTFVELLAMALPPDWQLSLYNRTQDMVDYLTAQSAIAQHDFALFTKAKEDHQSSEHPIVKILQYWQQNPHRWAQTEIAIVDYAMPKMTGLQLLASLDNWSGSNILLTGVADEVIAVQAFNENLIQQFIPKQSNNVIETLTLAVQHLEQQLFKPYQLLCEVALSPDQLMLLRAEKTQHDLLDFAKQHWVEYVVLANPWGVLGLSQSGQLSWLQIERACDIEDLKAIAENERWDSPALERIRSGTALSNSLLRQALNNQIDLAQAPVIPLGDSGLIAAHFEFATPCAYAATNTYNDWYKNNYDRTIKNEQA